MEAALTHWTLADMPSQVGRVAVVTGATGGLGFETTKALAAKGARVIVAGRDAKKGRACLSRIKQAHPAADLVFQRLDLADLRSVASFAEAIAAMHPAIDLLVNNAGLMAVPVRMETRDGFELQFGTNYLGHFALTGRLLPNLSRGQARVVNLSSLAHRRGTIDFADPQGRHYRPWKAYGQSKLAMLMFGIELQRRSAALDWGITGLAAHPGWANTDIFQNGPALGRSLGWAERLGVVAFPIFGQSASDGALPTLYAATAPGVQAGGYYGPDGFYELKGAPSPSRIEPQARDVDAAAKLWALSVHLTGVDPTLTPMAQPITA